MATDQKQICTWLHFIHTKNDLEKLGPQGQGMQLVMQDGEFHPYRGVSRPRTALEPVPNTLVDEEKRLLLPSERRANLEFMKKTNLAKQVLKQINAERAKAMNALRHDYKNGVIGVDNPNNLRSPHYGEKAAQLARVRAQTAQVRQRRKEKLLLANNSVARRGYDFLRFDSADPTASAFSRSEMPRKRAVSTAPGLTHDTHKRLFERVHRFDRGVRRSQGQERPFDIVTGVMVKPGRPANNNQ